jgi:hypothetical protein
VKKLRSLLVFLVIGGFLLLVYNRMFPNNEKQIRKMLTGLATAASIPAKPGPVAALMALDRIQSSFTPGVKVSIESQGGYQHTFSDRSELMEVVKGAWANFRSIDVQFFDVNLVVGPSKETASAHLTLKVTQTGQRDFFFQELKMEFQKIENNWRISKVATVESLRK